MSPFHCSFFVALPTSPPWTKWLDFIRVSFKIRLCAALDQVNQMLASHNPRTILISDLVGVCLTFSTALMSFDEVSPNSEKLSHPTANRPKITGRRLPAQFGGGPLVSTHSTLVPLDNYALLNHVLKKKKKRSNGINVLNFCSFLLFWWLPLQMTACSQGHTRLQSSH